MSHTIERVASWVREPGGIVHFRYRRNGTPYSFYATQETMQQVMHDICNMAANPVCELTQMDAAYLTDFIRTSMDLQPEAHQKPCQCKLCASRKRGEFIYSLMMFVCSGALMATLAVFVLWGAR